VNIVFGRMIRQRGKFRTPGTFRTQVIMTGTCPYLYLFYKKTQVKQYLNCDMRSHAASGCVERSGVPLKAWTLRFG
jgi:hypothetical protein